MITPERFAKTGCTLLPVSEMPSNVFYAASTYHMSSRANGEVTYEPTAKHELRSLLRRVANEHTDWSFVAKSYGCLNLEWFEVYAGNEKIGKLGHVQRQFHVGCNAIESKMERKDHKSVKDEDKAYKLTKKIAPKSLHEYMERANAAIYSALHSNVSEHASEANKALRDLTPYFAAFVRTCPEQAKQLLGEFNLAKEYIDRAIETDDQYRKALEMKDKRGHDYLTVLLRDGVYVVSNPKLSNGDPPVNPYWVTKDSEKLPPAIRRNLGMLKLLEEDNVSIYGIGYRYSATEFYVNAKEDV